MKRFFQIVLFSFILLGCSSVKNTAVDMGAGIISDASYEMETETNWENFRQAVPANLKMIEGLLYVNKKNDHLLSTLTKGYGAYAFVVYDSLYLEDQLKGNEMTSNREQALRYYNRSLEYGIRYLKQNGVNYDQLMQSIRQKGGVAKILDQKLGSDLADYESVFFLGQSLMGTINHNKAKIGLIAQLPLAKEMVDWACAKSPEIAGGTCKLVEAIYLASRPRSFGGDSEKAKDIFLNILKITLCIGSPVQVICSTILFRC